MSTMFRPFSGFVPTSPFGSRVVSPPRALLGDNQDAGVDDPLSFRYSVGRGAGPSSTEAQAWLDGVATRGAVRPVTDSVIVHRAEREGRSAIGVLGDLSLDSYEQDAVKAHEKTLANNSQKMVGYMLLTRLFGNPVVLAHRTNPVVALALNAHAESSADVDFVASDGTRHQLWIVTGDGARDLANLFVDDLYIADGHHRIAAACALAKAEGRADALFPAGLYAEDQFEVLAFARGVRQAPLQGSALISRLQDTFELVQVGDALPRPPAPRSFGTRIAGRSFLLTVPADLIDGDVRDRLDVSVLQRLILEPLLGITDPRRDGRLDAVADVGDATHDPDQYDAWFLPYPTPVASVMAVADISGTMPPKSTYFLPKLPGGILLRMLDEA